MNALKRRDFLRASAAALGVGVLAACQPKIVEVTKIVKEVVKETIVVAGTPEVVEKEVTKIVKETVAVEKVVKETVEVEKVVKETVVVEATPVPKIAGLEGKEGVLWGLQYDPHVSAYHRLAALFKKETGAILEVQPQGWPIEPKVFAAIAAGVPPDVVCICATPAAGLMIQKALMATDELVFTPLGIKPEELWVAAVLNLWNWQGHYYGVPVELTGCGWPVNVDVEQLEEAGVAEKNPPTNGEGQFETYEQMWECAKALMKKEDDRVTRWGISSQGWELNSYWGILDSLLASQNKQWWDEGARKFYFDTDEGVKAMQLLVETPVKMGIETQFDKQGIDMALAGQVALVRGNGGPSGPDAWELGYHYFLVAAPHSVPGTPETFVDWAAWGFVAPVEAKNPDISVAFLKMMCTLDGQREYARIYGGMSQVSFYPLIEAADHFDNPDPNSVRVKAFKIFREIVAPNSVAPGYFNSWALESTITPPFADVRTGKITAKEAVSVMQEIAEGVDKAWLERLEQTS